MKTRQDPSGHMRLKGSCLVSILLTDTFCHDPRVVTARFVTRFLRDQTRAIGLIAWTVVREAAVFAASVHQLPATEQTVTMEQQFSDLSKLLCNG